MLDDTTFWIGCVFRDFRFFKGSGIDPQGVPIVGREGDGTVGYDVVEDISGGPRVWEKGICPSAPSNRFRLRVIFDVIRYRLYIFFPRI